MPGKSKVNPAVEAFMRGEDPRGKRPKKKKKKVKMRRLTDAVKMDMGLPLKK